MSDAKETFGKSSVESHLFMENGDMKVTFANKSSMDENET